MVVHDGCGDSPIKKGKQAPIGTVHQFYNNTVLDTYKVAGAMYTEMDTGIQNVIDALKEKDMWNNTILIFVCSIRCVLLHLYETIQLYIEK